MESPSLRTRLWRCTQCQAEQRRDVNDDRAPVCGYLSRDRTTFPGGGWIQVEQYDPHPDMVLVPDSVLDRFHPDLVALREEAMAGREEAMAQAAARSVAESNLRAGIKVVEISAEDLDYSPEGLLEDSDPSRAWGHMAPNTPPDPDPED